MLVVSPSVLFLIRFRKSDINSPWITEEKLIFLSKLRSKHLTHSLNLFPFVRFSIRESALKSLMNSFFHFFC